MKTLTNIQTHIRAEIIAITMLISLLTFQNVTANNDSGLFERSMTFEQLSAKAEKEGTPIFLLIGSKSCFSYRRFCAKVLQDQSVITFFKSNFVCYSVEISTKEGRKLSKEYEAYILPTIIFFTPDRRIHMSTNGSLDISKVLKQANNALQMIKMNALDRKPGLRSKNLKTLNKQTQIRLGIEYAERDSRDGKKDARKQLLEYTFDSNTLKYFRKAYLESMQKQKASATIKRRP